MLNLLKCSRCGTVYSIEVGLDWWNCPRCLTNDQPIVLQVWNDDNVFPRRRLDLGEDLNNQAT